TRWLRNISLRGASMNIVLSQGMLECITKQDVNLENIKVIHNWADGDQIHPISRKENSLRQSWNLQDKFVVGYSGNMGRAHEFGTIIGAMKQLKNDDRIVFLLIGGGAGRKLLENAVSEFGLSNCLFKPYQPRERLSESLSVADVHLVSLRPEVEGLIVPSKVYGIAAAGRPLIYIGDANGEVGQLISRFGLGFTVPKDYSDLLVRHISELEKNSSMAIAMGEKSRNCYEQYFNQQRSIAEWKSTFKRLAVKKS
ncbi:MAG: glycosyltransferase family 4 protein, partial [Gammaproteobacteria bacterium]|nr:glycosyltransferase family 4 protein [Gammaproteobacteria bacterium]